MIKEDESLEAEDREKARKDLRKEAELLANLNHPNIVTVYNVGETDGGTYLCMEYLEQGSLADDLARRDKSGEWPTPKEAAEVVLTLAEALEAVHQKEILHRDLKPGNVLMSKRLADGKVVLKISDFGLARLIKRPPGPAPDRLPTSIGKAKGTPAYMAPEQASGVVVNLKPAADVYALGAILYELLTRRAPYQGARTEILAQVKSRSAEPPRPRKLDRRVPRDLEWICLKSLQHRWQKRYQSARELADELRRFRDNEPVRACPSRLLEPVIWSSKWVQRNPWLSGFIALLLVLSAAGVFGTWYFNYLNGITTKALKGETDAKNAETDAKNKADDQRAKAEALAAIAQKAFSQVLERVGRKPLTATSPLERVPTRLLEDALTFFQSYRSDVDQAPERRFDSARTRRWIGDVMQLLGRNAEAEKAYADALAFCATDGETSPQWRQESAQLHNNRGILYVAKGDAVRAEAEFRTAVGLRRILAKQPPYEPIYRHELALSLENLADLLTKSDKVRRRDEVNSTYKEAVGLLRDLANKFHGEDLPVLGAGTAGLLGSPLGQGPFLSASALFPGRTHGDRKYRWELAECYGAWANLFDDDNNLAVFKDHGKQALDVLDDLAREQPTDFSVRYLQSQNRSVLGQALLDAGGDELPDAERYFKEARDQLKRLSQDFGTVVGGGREIREANEDLQTVALAHADDGDEFAEDGEWHEAETAYGEAIRLLEELSKESSPPQNVQKVLLTGYLSLGNAFVKEGNRDKAEETYNRAYTSFKKLLQKHDKRDPLMKWFREAFGQLATSYRDDGDSLLNDRRYAEAVPPYRKSAALFERMKNDFSQEDFVVQRDLALARDRLARALDGEAELKVGAEGQDGAAAGRKEAAATYRQAYAEFPTSPKGALSSREEAQYEEERGAIAGRLGWCLQKLGEIPQARTALEDAFQHFQEAHRLDEVKPLYADELFECAGYLTEVLLQLEEHEALAAAAKKWREQLAANPAVDFLAAAAFARCIPIAHKDAKLPEAERSRLEQVYASESVGALREWIRKAYDDRKARFDPTLLTGEEKLASLRPFDAFGTLVDERKKASKTLPPNTPSKQP